MTIDFAEVFSERKSESQRTERKGEDAEGSGVRWNAGPRTDVRV